MFDDDRGFWSAVQTFMKTTKRPIILTATDRRFVDKFGGRCETLQLRTPKLVRLFVYALNCNCKYDKLYSTVSGKPLLGCFTRMFTVSEISNAWDYRSSTVSTVFESRKGFGFPNSCRKYVDQRS